MESQMAGANSAMSFCIPSQNNLHKVPLGFALGRVTALNNLCCIKTTFSAALRLYFLRTCGVLFSVVSFYLVYALFFAFVLSPSRVQLPTEYTHTNKQTENRTNRHFFWSKMFQLSAISVSDDSQSFGPKHVQHYFALPCAHLRMK
ncbi:hypothetical protein VNO77_42626 [Canavalia gladiata]|uniref:Transmembrane protein n=1 Tax=Canavalia gladiata TaxID=3824 RepID=A0AAN9JUV7_CANGL